MMPKLCSLALLAAVMLLSGCSAKFIKECCVSPEPVRLRNNENKDFIVDLKKKCNPSGIILEEGHRYSFRVEALTRLADGRIKCLPPKYDADGDECRPVRPDGFSANSLPWFPRLVLGAAQRFRPIGSAESNWLEVVGTVGHGNKEFFQVIKYIAGTSPYEAKETGEFYALANDYPWLGRYANNIGILRVTVTHVVP